MAERPITSDCAIKSYFHCALCLDERPDDQSPAEWARLNVGFTTLGLQVWCQRHDCNVLHIDFENQTHPANTNRNV